MTVYENLKEVNKEAFEKAKQTILKPSVTLEGWPEVKGYDFSKPFDFQTFMNAFMTTGFQATHLAQAVDIVKKMRKENATIFLAFTSNMVSCGVREIISYLAKESKIHVLCTTVGGIEEDIIKAKKPFVLGKFRTSDKALRDNGINRTGNLFIPNDRYLEFERFMMPFFEKLYARQKETGEIISGRVFVEELGKELDDERSILHWAVKNKIPYFCPALTDGSMGDMLYFFKQRRPDFKIDCTDDIVEITNIAINAEKTGIIVIGGSVPKHHVANANLFREGADYTVYINTANEGDGSNAGALPEEAISWGKVNDKAEYVKVEGDASIIFPLLVAGAFLDEEEKTAVEEQ